MKVIISPAKKMKITYDKTKKITNPIFFDKAYYIAKIIKEFSPEEIESVMKVNPKIAMDTFIYYNDFFEFKHEIPAILSYNGLQYTHINAENFKGEDYDFINKTIRILSGLYGILRPYDGICPYRLELQSKVKIDQKNLYQFWADSVYNEIYKEDEEVINLASKEYSKLITPYLKPQNRFITIDFKCHHKGKIKTIATQAKMLRGEMVKYIVDNKINKSEDLKNFCYNGYKFTDDYSSNNDFIFFKA